jgi:hypothetical protein
VCRETVFLQHHAFSCLKTKKYQQTFQNGIKICYFHIKQFKKNYNVSLMIKCILPDREAQFDQYVFVLKPLKHPFFSGFLTKIKD